jgi:hypothetical protein
VSATPFRRARTLLWSSTNDAITTFNRCCSRAIRCSHVPTSRRLGSLGGSGGDLLSMAGNPRGDGLSLAWGGCGDGAGVLGKDGGVGGDDECSDINDLSFIEYLIKCGKEQHLELGPSGRKGKPILDLMEIDNLLAGIPTPGFRPLTAGDAKHRLGNQPGIFPFPYRIRNFSERLSQDPERVEFQLLSPDLKNRGPIDSSFDNQYAGACGIKQRLG